MIQQNIKWAIKNMEWTWSFNTIKCYCIGQNLIHVKIDLFFPRRLILNFLWEKEKLLLLFMKG